MRTMLLAGAGWIVLTATFAGCSDSSGTRTATLSFERVEIEGVTTDHASTGGVSWVDYDGDGDLDLFVTNGYDVSAEQPVGQPDRLYRNDGVGGFVAVAEGPFAAEAGVSSASTWGDYDNDGDLDVFITNQQDQDNFLFRNDRDGRFTRITDEAPTMDGGHSYAATWVDVDADGWLDLFVANGGMSHAGANGLYRGTGDGHFEKITEGEIVTVEAATCGIAWGDHDNDGDLDLFLANQGFAPPGNNNEFYRNEGEWRFTRITDSPVVADGLPSCAATWVDIDNDLDLDLHVTTLYGVANLLYLNDGSGGLTPVVDSPLTIDAGHSFGAIWADLDNDGDVDTVVANWGAGQNFYRNDGHGIFVRATSGEIDGRVEYAGAIACGDGDGDGDIDVYVGNWPNYPGPGEPNSFYRNEGGGGHWLEVMLVGATGGTGGIGARVLVTTAGGTQMREVTSQSGFRGQNDLASHFGLGDHDRATLVEVRWPSGRVSTMEDVAVDQTIEIIEPRRPESAGR